MTDRCFYNADGEMLVVPQLGRARFVTELGVIEASSGEIVIMAVMGGMRAFWGPLLGAAVFVVLQDYISSMTVNWMSFIGLIFVLVVLFFPRGLLGMLQRRNAA